MTNPKAQTFPELTAAIEEFKSHHTSELGDMKSALDDVNTKIAALLIGGGAEERTSPNGTADFKTFTNFMRKGPSAGLTGAEDADGGYAVPKQVDKTINDQLVSFSPMRAIARVVQAETRDYHTLVGVRGSTSGWAGEEDTRGDTNSPQMADIAPPSGEVFAYPSATNWVLDDAFFDLEGWLQSNVTDEIAIKEGEAFISGDGNKKPRGLLSYAPGDHPAGDIGVTVSGAANALKLEGLVDLVYDLPAPYRQGAVHLMNSTTAAAVSKIKDGNGNFIWQPGLQLGQPSQLLGHPVVIDESMPNVSAGATPIAFGNFKRGYLIVDYHRFKVVRDNVTKPGWTKFYFSRRVGGAVTDSKALRLHKIAAS